MALHHHFIEGLYGPLKAVKTMGRLLGLTSSNSLRVLIYHDISPQEQPLFVSQLLWLKRSWRFVSPDQFAALSSGGEPVFGRNLLLTFDDGVASQRRIAEEVLKPMGIRAVFFVAPDLVSDKLGDDALPFIAGRSVTRSQAQRHSGHLPYMGWSDLEALLEQGHCVGSHTATHARLSEIQTEAELEREIVASADTLGGRLGVSIEHFAYPFGNVASFSTRALAVARRRFRFIHSGVRGDNARNVSPSRLWRDAVTPQDSRALLGAYLEGAADFYYARSRGELARWVSEGLGRDEGPVATSLTLDATDDAAGHVTHG
jgi:peptidoglycan/xylan/chitin deacetylase (PgdA/CDA1 family)